MLPHKRPLPLSARFLSGTSTIEVTWDHTLVTRPINAPNWTCRANNNSYAGQVAPNGTAAGNITLVPVLVGFPNPGPDVCTFNPPPNDVRSKRANLPALDFVDFPMVVVP